MQVVSYRDRVSTSEQAETKVGTMFKPVAPTSSPTSTNPEDVKAWDDYYAECENWADAQKPCMDRDW